MALNCSRAVKLLALAKLRPTVRAVPPLYEPEKVRLPSVAVRVFKFEPRAMPEMVELVRPALFKVPERVGVTVRAPDDGTIFWPTVKPLKERVEVEKATAVAVVEAYPEPRAVK